MDSKPKRAKQKSSVRPCPQGCGFSLHDSDQHDACPVCLGIVHARRASTEPEACAFCRQLRRSTLERRVTFVERVLGRSAVARHDPLLSESGAPASSESEDENFQVDVPAISWADHMEYVDGLADDGPEPCRSADGLQPGLKPASAPQEDDDVLDIGLDIHGLSEDEQESSLSTQYAAAAAPVGHDDTSLFSLFRRAAEKLQVDWPSPPPARKPSRFAGFFLPPEPATAKNCLPMFPDFLCELTASWDKPLSTRVTVPGYGQYMELDGAEGAGLANPPPMEPSLAAYLAPSHNHGVGGPATLPSKHCRFSASQLEKIYRAQAGTARAMSSVTMLQTYQAMCLAELGSLVPEDSPLSPLLNEVRVTTDYILRASCCAALSLGRGMASTVVAQRHLWLTLSDVPDRDRAVYLDAPVSAAGLFGHSLEAIQARFDLRKKQTEALRDIIPRRQPQPKPTASSHRPAAPLTAGKRPAPTAGVGGPPARARTPARAPRQSAWGKGRETQGDAALTPLLPHKRCRLSSVQVVSPRRRCTSLSRSPKHITPAHGSDVLNVQATTSSVPAVFHRYAPEKVHPTKCINVHVPMLQSIKSVVYSQTISNAQPAGEMSQVRQGMQSPADTLGGDGAPPSVLQASRLAAHFPQWRACAPSPWVLQTVAMGYRLQFRVKPPRFQRVVNTIVNPEAALVLREEIQALLQKRAIRVVPASETDKGWYSRYFVIPKKGGGLRPILDLRVLNTYLRTYRFKMLTLRQLLSAVGPGDWFATIDLTDAYFHVAIHPKHRQFLRFAFEGVAYEYLVLPFGLSLAPRTFTKCAEAALAPLRKRGIRILAYLDDWALVACSREQAETQLSRVLSHIQTLGFSVNFQKSSLIPGQQIAFLGLEICSLSSRARLSEHRVAAFHRCLAQFQLGRRLRFQTILRLLGMMASMIAVVPLGLLKMRAFQRWTLSHRLCASRHLRRRLPVTASCMLALRPWREPGLLHQGSRIGRVLFRKVVSTDASLSGWGALCEGASVRGIWSAAQRQLHINHLELLAVFLALKRFRPVLQGQHVLVRTDNSTVVSYINRQGGTRSLPLLQLSRSLLLWCSVHFLTLRATHVPGHLNLGPDLLSRGGPLVREWRLHPSIVAQIWDLFGEAQIDLFASRVNAHCPLYFSIIDHDAPLGLDALAHQWPDVLLYAFPPVEMISPILERVRRHSLSLILVAPWWPAKSWYAEIISLLAASPWQLPLRRDLLSQAGGEVFHPRPDLWHLHAYLLRG
ncbi:uncharacterized protein LOC112431703 [Maylandia zebra]|uniref:uncharacterized protein LOC112431703 n=1 Tax=Maylandia zebra TaxID=106582 RepID=UPI00403C119C